MEIKNLNPQEKKYLAKILQPIFTKGEIRSIIGLNGTQMNNLRFKNEKEFKRSRYGV